MIFNEHVMYKDGSITVSYITGINQKKSEFVNLDELNESIVHKSSEKYKFTGRS